MDSRKLKKLAQSIRRSLHSQTKYQFESTNIVTSTKDIEQIALAYFTRLIALAFIRTHFDRAWTLDELHLKYFPPLEPLAKKYFPKNWNALLQATQEALSETDAESIEVLGWLYQFYISERKDAVFASKGRVAKEDIPAVTQLFTPRWIVEYLVQNTLGKLWLQNRTDSQLEQAMPYFIKTPVLQQTDFLQIKSVEEIRLLDQACGCGHILVYAFDLFAKIYEEAGYAPQDIPKRIIEQNLYGFEIDAHAAQLTRFALLMKAWTYYKGSLEQNIKPNILCFQAIEELDILEDAKNLGALLHPKFLESQKLKAVETFMPLTQKYHCIVNNPPYMGSHRMNDALANFVKKNYPDSKANLMAVFMEVALECLLPKGFLGIINQQAWMFLNSYKRLRQKLLQSVHFDTLLHLGTRTFPEISGEVVQNVAFTFWNKICHENGTYIKLLDTENSEAKRLQTLDSIQKPASKLRYELVQEQFQKLPNHTIGYWVEEQVIEALQYPKLSEFATTRLGMASADNAQFLRFFWEIPLVEISFEGANKDKKWFPYVKGGAFRKWYGNMQQVVNWENEGAAIRHFKNTDGKVRSHNYNLDYIFKEGITWNALSSGVTCFRVLENALFDNSGSSLFPFSEGLDKRFLLGLLNSKVVRYFLPIISPTLNYQPGTMAQIPVLPSTKIDLKLVDSCIEIAKEDWNSRETAWDFQGNELLRFKGKDLAATYTNYKTYWRKQFHKLHAAEVQLNQQFIKLYDLQKILTPDVSLEEISILKEETSIENGKLVFNAKAVFTQLVSYIVGRAMRHLNGRATAVRLSTNDDNSLIAYCYTYLKATFGEASFAQNLVFLEVQLGKSLQKYLMQDFYKDHLRRYKKRPIYWLFASPKGSFQVFVYMHTYTTETLKIVLTQYLQPHIKKLRQQPTKNQKTLQDCFTYERILQETIQQNISLNLDDGILVNYNRLGKAVKTVKGLNDDKTRAKVRNFEWLRNDKQINLYS